MNRYNKLETNEKEIRDIWMKRIDDIIESSSKPQKQAGDSGKSITGSEFIKNHNFETMETEYDNFRSKLNPATELEPQFPQKQGFWRTKMTAREKDYVRCYKTNKPTAETVDYTKLFEVLGKQCPEWGPVKKDTTPKYHNSKLKEYFRAKLASLSTICPKGMCKKEFDFETDAQQVAFEKHKETCGCAPPEEPTVGDPKKDGSAGVKVPKNCPMGPRCTLSQKLKDMLVSSLRELLISKVN